ncbi:replication-relaxation family protein [Streptomyces olivoreticuli]
MTAQQTHPSSSKLSGLTDRDRQLVADITRFGQLEAKQAQRLHFAEEKSSKESREVRAWRTLKRLADRKVVSRIERTLGGGGGGSTGYVYQAPTSRADGINYHKLDIAELYVRLVELERREPERMKLVRYRPELYTHRRPAKGQPKPDARIEVEVAGALKRWQLELDRGTEWPYQIRTKLKQYVRAWENWEEDFFPPVLFVVGRKLTVDERERKELLQEQIDRLPEADREPFGVVVFDEAVEWLVPSDPGSAKASG